MKKFISFFTVVLMAVSMMATPYKWDGRGVTTKEDATEVGGKAVGFYFANGTLDLNTHQNMMPTAQKGNFCLKINKGFKESETEKYYFTIKLDEAVNAGDTLKIAAFRTGTQSCIMGMDFSADSASQSTTHQILAEDNLQVLSSNGTPVDANFFVPVGVSDAKFIRVYRKSGNTGLYIAHLEVAHKASAPGPEPTANYYLVGTLAENGWDQNNAMPMINDEITRSVEAGAYDFKVLTELGSWSGALGYADVDAECSSEGYEGSDNVKVVLAEAGDVTVKVVEGKICVTGNFGAQVVVNSMTVVGTIPGLTWDADNTENDMTLADGVWTLTHTNVALEAETYSYKMTANHKWGDLEFPASGNATLEITEAGNYDIVYTVNVETGDFGAVATPATPAQGWDGSVLTSMDNGLVTKLTDLNNLILTLPGANSVAIADEEECQYMALQNEDGSELYGIWGPTMGSDYTIEGNTITLDGFMTLEPHTIAIPAGTTKLYIEDYGTLVIDGEGEYLPIIELAANIENPGPGPDPIATIEPGTYCITSFGEAGNVAATALAADKTYGYLSVVEWTGYLDDMTNNEIFEFEAVDGEEAHFYIKQNDGRYLYMTGTYNSFNVSDDKTVEGAKWEVALQSNSTMKITNLSTNKFVQYSTTHTSYGAYAEQGESNLATVLVAATKKAEPLTFTFSYSETGVTITPSNDEETYVAYIAGETEWGWYGGSAEAFAAAYLPYIWESDLVKGEQTLLFEDQCWYGAGNYYIFAAGAIYDAEEEGGIQTSDAVAEEFAIDENKHLTDITITMAEANKLAKDEEATLGAFTVIYVNGAYMYIQDETGTTLLYKYEYGLELGDKVAAGMKVKGSPYKNLPEILPITAYEDLTVTPAEEGDIIVYEEATEAPSKENLNEIVWYTITVAENAEFVSTSKTTVNATAYIGGEEVEVAFYNTFLIEQTLEAGVEYNILGANAIYNENIQVYPLAVFTPVEIVVATDFEDIEMEPNSNNKADIYEAFDPEEMFAYWITNESIMFENFVYDYGSAESSYYMGTVAANYEDNDITTGWYTPGNDLKTAVGGAAEGNNYAVVYDSGYKMYFAATATIEGMALTNTAVAEAAILGGDGMSVEEAGSGLPFGAGDYFKVTFTGYIFDEVENDYVPSNTKVDFYLADFRTEGEWKYAKNWQWVDLTELGEIDAMSISFDGTKRNSYGLTTPAYVAIDAINGDKEACNLGEMTPVLPEGLENANSNISVMKQIENGQLIIIKNGVRYNVVGTRF